MKIRNQENGRQVPAKTKKYKKKRLYGTDIYCPLVSRFVSIAVFIHL